MAEVIGLVSGLLTLASAGKALCETLYTFSKALRTAERDIKLVREDLKNTTAVIKLLGKSLDDFSTSRSQIVAEALETVPGLTGQCDYVFKHIERLIEYLQPYYNSSTLSSGQQLILRDDPAMHIPKLLDKWRWQRRKAEIDDLRKCLEALKSNLQLLFSVMQYQRAEERDAPSQMRRILQEELAIAFRNANICSEDLDQQTARAGIKPESKTLVVQSHSMHALRPQRAIKDLAIAHFKQEIESKSTDPNQHEARVIRSENEWTSETQHQKSSRLDRRGSGQRRQPVSGITTGIASSPNASGGRSSPEDTVPCYGVGTLESTDREPACQRSRLDKKELPLFSNTPALLDDLPLELLELSRSGEVRLRSRSGQPGIFLDWGRESARALTAHGILHATSEIAPFFFIPLSLSISEIKAVLNICRSEDYDELFKASDVMVVDGIRRRQPGSSKLPDPSHPGVVEICLVVTGRIDSNGAIRLWLFHRLGYKFINKIGYLWYSESNEAADRREMLATRYRKQQASDRRVVT